MYKKIILTAVALLGIAVSPLGVNAQQTGNLTPFNCFDTYQFGSVSADIAPKVIQTLAGSQLSFTLNTTNNNDYPIVDGSVYVKIFQKQTDLKNAQKNGGYLVDQFFAKEGITLAARETKRFEFTWNVPAYAPTGDYQAFTYFESAKKFNMLGLSFTDDVTGGKTDFKIKSESKQVVQFDKNNVQINDQIRNFATPIPKLSATDKVVIKLPLKNSTTKAQDAEVTYTLYSWDGLLESQKLSQKTETVNLKPSETKTLVYEVTDVKYPVYYVVAQSKWKDFSSIIDARFARENINRPRINFIGTTAFPLENGKEASLVACVHNISDSSPINGKVEVQLLDSNNAVIGNYNYTGEITSDIVGLKTLLTPTKTYDNFKIHTKLFDDKDQIIDEAELSFVCDAIDKKLCNPTAAPIAPNENLPPRGSSIYIWLGIGIVVLAGIIIAFVIIRKKKHQVNYPPNTPPSGPITTSSAGPIAVIVFTLLGITSIIFGTYSSALADKSVTHNYSIGQVNSSAAVLFAKFSSIFPTGGINPKPLELNTNSMQYSFTYNARVTDSSGVVLSDGSNIPVNSKIILSYDPNDFLESGSQTASWFGIGAYNDSPYGHWVNGAAFPSSGACNASDELSIYIGNPVVSNIVKNVYAPLSVNPPKITMGVTDPHLKDCVDMAGGTKKMCTIASPGTFNVDFVFAETYAYHYSAVKRTNNQCVLGSKMYTKNGNIEQDFKINIPTQTISFQLSGVNTQVGGPPGGPNTSSSFVNDPTITGPTTGAIDQAYTFTAFSISSGDGEITYDFDLDNNTSTIDGSETVPASENASTNMTWTTVGTKIINVRATLTTPTEIISSKWVPHTIVISDKATCTPTPDPGIWTSCSASCGGGTRNLIKIDASCHTTVIGSPQSCNIQPCGVIIKEVRPG